MGMDLFAVYAVVQKILWVPAIDHFTRFKYAKVANRLWQQPSEMVVLAALLIAFGQVLNYAVYKAIGFQGVQYGQRYGAKLPWVKGFPFVVPDPQYLGFTLTLVGACILT